METSSSPFLTCLVFSSVSAAYTPAGPEPITASRKGCWGEDISPRPRGAGRRVGCARGAGSDACGAAAVGAAHLALQWFPHHCIREIRLRPGHCELADVRRRGAHAGPVPAGGSGTTPTETSRVLVAPGGPTTIPFSGGTSA